jgi:hypothetical protein
MRGSLRRLFVRRTNPATVSAPSNLCSLMGGAPIGVRPSLEGQSYKCFANPVAIELCGVGSQRVSYDVPTRGSKPQRRARTGELRSKPRKNVGNCG